MGKKIKIYFIKSVLLSGLFILSLAPSWAQQEAMFTQYMFNGLAINPAYAGSHESLSATLLFRDQWTGLPGAPSTQTFSVHSPIRNEKIALGLQFIHDKIAIFNQYGVNGSYAYRIFTDKGTLSLGLQFGITSYNADLSSLTPPDPSDPVFQGDVNKVMPNFGAGIYYYTDRFYIGLSAPQLVTNSLSEDVIEIDGDARQDRHYFLTVGHMFELSHNVKLKPNILIKAVEGAPIQMDLNLNALFSDVLWLGVSWRSLSDFDALLALQLTDQLLLGYSYDFAHTTDLSRINSGSHELMLNYRFRYAKNKVITPRYF
jgi:type IX secretion system PorP/SprF family membrane protein